MTSEKAIDDVFEIDDLRVLEAMNNPTRLRVLNQLTQPHSVKEVATALQLPPTRLYYHVNALEKAGVIRVVETRKVGAMMEKLYQVVATHFRPGPKIAEGIEDFEWAADVMAGAVLDGARLDAVSALSAHLSDVSSGASIENLPGTLGRSIGSMTAEKAAVFVKKLEELAVEMAGDEADEADAEEYAYSFVFFRMSAPVRGVGS